MLQSLFSPFHSFEYKFVVILILTVTSVQFTIEHDHFYVDNNHHTENRLSLESCLGRFDVHGNTIIRTGESQAIGGKFLQGLELETPEKCQRLCCETTNCDVYVFEEKNDGYCYLFQCGSPKNFHCKFTRHSNYTSALLTQFKSTITTTPRPIIYVPKINISTQEQELISLKAKPEKYLVSSTTQTISQLQIENGLLTGVPESRNLSCGRFEFPCHSGECIAVYNACNGIPQCLDGSDEGPECMDPTNTKTNNNNNNKYREHVKPDNIHDSSIYRHSLREPIVDNSNLENRHPMIYKETKNSQNDVTNDLESISSLNNNNGHIQNVMSLERPTGKLIQNQAEIYEQLPEIKSSYATPHLAQEKAHIFNENSKWPTQQRTQFHIATHEPPFSALSPPMTNSENAHKQLVNEEMSNTNSRTFDQDSETGQRLQNNANLVGKSSEQADYSDKPKDSTKKDMASRKDEPSIASTTIKKVPHPAFVEQFKAMEQHLEIKYIDHDGHSEKPRGAVLSLTLGLLITGVIIIMIGCRLRTIGRRGSRHGGKTPYAPDEDFLVNGMYL